MRLQSPFTIKSQTLATLLLWGLALAALMLPLASAAFFVFGNSLFPLPRGSGLQDVGFAVSPDGRTLAFNAVGEGGRDLFLLDLKTAEVRLLAATEGDELAPAFSPDGQRLVYPVAEPGAWHHRLAIRDLATGQTRLITPEGMEVAAPQFSPDGQTIAFLADTTFNPGGKSAAWTPDELMVIDAKGGEPRRIDGGPPWCESFCWQPDGGGLIVSVDGGLRVIALGKDRGPGRIRADSLRQIAISRDGRRICGSAGRFLHEVELYLLPRHGGLRNQITDSDQGSTHPAFAPDGQTIYFLRSTATAWDRQELWRTDIEGQNPQRIAGAELFANPLGRRNAGAAN